MSFVNAVPGNMGTTATNLAGIGATISAANAMAAMPTTSLVASAQDQVSAAVADFFTGHAQGYQQLGAQVEAFHQNFVQVLKSGAGAYATAEADNATATADAAVAPREHTNQSDNPAPARPQTARGSLDGNRAVSGAPTAAPAESIGGPSTVPGLISVGGAGRVGVPMVERGVGTAARPFAAAGANVPDTRPGGARSTLAASSVRGETPRPLAVPAPRARVAHVILNARGGGSGGTAQRGRHSAMIVRDGGAGGIGTRQAR